MTQLDPFYMFLHSPDFEKSAAAVWKMQYEMNPVLREFCDRLGRSDQLFLPIEFFKKFEIKTGEWEPEVIFRSSGTTGQTRSQHLVADQGNYRITHLAGFHHFYGKGKRTIFALLPNYLEKGDSSLVHMAKDWIESFGARDSGFFLYEYEELHEKLLAARERKTPILLLGVAYALLDFAENYPVELPENAIVMETGGMKGRKEELTREELHARLKAGFGDAQIHSEYGMTELMSQAYAKETGRFHTPPWMKVVITDVYRHDEVLPPGRSGRINIIDLANFKTCSFIQTQDQGICHEDGSFEILGRLDHAEMRGCSLMYV